MSVYDEITQAIVAELGAAFLYFHLRIPSILRENHAAYINGWIWILKEDKQAIFKAASHATKAADYLREKAVDSELQIAYRAATATSSWN